MRITPALQAYVARRDAFLQRVLADLQRDDRFVAAWLAGSFGRGEADLISDLDLHLVVTDAYADTILIKPAMVWASTTAERMVLFHRYGEPVILHENHHNAIGEGTFTYCEYADLVKVDWTLMAQSKALRPAFARLLFERVAIPQAVAPVAESLAERQEAIAEKVGYFWLMAATGCKYIVRGDAVAVIQQFKMVHDTLDEIERLLQGQPPIWGREHIEPFHVEALDMPYWAAQVQAMCHQMVAMYPRIEAFVGHAVHPIAIDTIEALLALNL